MEKEATALLDDLSAPRPVPRRRTAASETATSQAG
jgi:biopolymer transport protein ExbB